MQTPLQIHKGASPEEIEAFKKRQAAGYVPVRPDVQATETAVEAPKPKVRRLNPAKVETVPLSDPLEYDGVEYHEARIQTPKSGGKMFRAAQALMAEGQNDTSVMMHLLTDLPIAVIDELDDMDFAAISTAMLPFIPAKLLGEAAPTSPTGPNTPPS